MFLASILKVLIMIYYEILKQDLYFTGYKWNK